MTAAREHPPDDRVDDDPVAAAVRRAVEKAPPLSAEQRDRLRGLLNPSPIPSPREAARRSA